MAKLIYVRVVLNDIRLTDIMRISGAFGPLKMAFKAMHFMCHEFTDEEFQRSCNGKNEAYDVIGVWSSEGQVWQASNTSVITDGINNWYLEDYLRVGLGAYAWSDCRENKRSDNRYDC